MLGLGVCGTGDVPPDAILGRVVAVKQFLLRRGFDAATVRTVTRADDVDDSADEFE